MVEQKDIGRQEVALLKKQIDSLEEAPTQINQEIDGLKTREAQFLKELEDIRAAINDQENKLNQLPKAVSKIKEDMASKIRQTRALHQSIKPISGTVEEDNRLINEIDQIHLRAVNLIQKPWDHYKTMPSNESA